MIDIEILYERLLESYNLVADCLDKFQKHSVSVVIQEFELNSMLLNAYLDGAIDGKNEQIRTAQGNRMFKEQVDKLQNDKNVYTLLKLDLDKARLTLDMNRDFIRLLELGEK